MTDLATGLYAHGAIMAALIQRIQTGKGQKISCDLLSTQVRMIKAWGRSQTMLTSFGGFFDHRLPCFDIFCLINVDKMAKILDYLPLFVNLVCERLPNDSFGEASCFSDRNSDMVPVYRNSNQKN